MKIDFLVGPTAVGKTAVAVALAEQLGAEIISADSVQLYRGLDIGSAKPTSADQRRVPHHLLNILKPDEPFTVARYRTVAQLAIRDITRRGRRVLVVGGSGLYIRALTDGLCRAPAGDEQVRQRLRAEAAGDPEKLYRRLCAVDATAAHRIGPHNLVRLVRALEVFMVSGLPLSAFWDSTGAPPYRVNIVGCARPREELYRRIDARVAWMWENGLRQECEKLRQCGYHRACKPLRSLGYRHMLAYLADELPEADARRLMARDTRRFAKRQLTWFRRDARIRWLHPETDRSEMLHVLT